MSATAIAPALSGVSLAARDLHHRYGVRRGLEPISFSLAAPGAVAITGANGSGKSTLLKSIVGVVEIMSGRVLVGDEDVTGWASENVARIGVGYVPQVNDIFEPLTVRENLEMGGYLLSGSEIEERIQEVARHAEGERLPPRDLHRHEGEPIAGQPSAAPGLDRASSHPVFYRAVI